MISFSIRSVPDAELWCTKFISPRTYYTHTKLGGYGWYISSPSRDPKLNIYDEKQGLLAILKFGDQM